MTISVTPTVGVPVFSLGATSNHCQLAGTVTYTASATNTTGITYTLDAASTSGGNSIIASTGAVTYVAGWSGTSIITASAAGCNGPFTATHSVETGNIWNGNSGKDWNMGSNWCTNNKPITSTDVIIPNVLPSGNWPEIGVSTSADCHNLLIQPGASLTIQSDATGSGSLIVSGTHTGGGIFYNRDLASDRWYITSPPLNNGFNYNYNGATIEIIGGTYNFSPYTESFNQGWLYPYASMPATLTPGTGYIIKLKTGNSVQYSGSINGDITLSLPSSGPSYGWSAIGNPYTSALRIKNETGYQGFLYQNRNSLDPEYQAIYVWNQTSTYTGAEQYYKVICSAGYTGYTYADSLPQKYVQPGQGFLVNIDYNESSPGAPSNVVFKKGTTAPLGMQMHNSTSLLKSTETSWPGLTLLATSNGRTGSTVVAFNEDMTTGLDPSYDAGLLAASDFNLYTHLVSGENETDFAIQSLPDNMYDTLAVPVGIDVPQAGKLTFRAAGVILPEGVYPVVEDRLLRVNVPLAKESDSLSVYMNEPTWGIGRFYLHFGGTSGTVSARACPEARRFTAHFDHGKITLYGKPEPGTRVWLYDLNGRKMGGEYRLKAVNQNEIPAGWLSNGIYLLNIEGKTSRQILKIAVIND